MNKLPPIPENEQARLEALRRYKILDTPPEQAFDDITMLASFICRTPIAVMSLIDDDRQWFKSKVGVPGTQTPRQDAFCAHTILQNEVLMVEDALTDDRFAKNPLVTGDPNIRFYAGAPLVTSEGFELGSLCVIDREPRKISEEQLKALAALARMVVSAMELREVSAQLAEATASLKTLSGMVPICSYCKCIRNDQGFWEQVERYVRDHTHAKFTHGVCPDCSKKFMASLGLEKK